MTHQTCIISHEKVSDESYNAFATTDIDDDVLESRSYSVANPNDFNPTFYNPFEIKHRQRISQEQFKKLENAFIDNPKPNGKIRKILAEKVSMTPRGVQVWFQNRRAKAKQQKELQKKQKRKKPKVDSISLTKEMEDGDETAPFTMVHSRFQSSTSSSTDSTNSYVIPMPHAFCIDYTQDNANITSSVLETQISVDPYQNFPIAPHGLSQTWHSDSSTITGVDEDDFNMIKSPFVPVQTQLFGKVETESNANQTEGQHNSLWNHHYYSAYFLSPPDQNLLLQHTSSVTLEEKNHVTDKHNQLISNILHSESDPLLDPWVYLDNLTQCNSQLYDKKTLNTENSVNGMNSILYEEVKPLDYSHYEIEYSQHVADWIQTVSLSRNKKQETMHNLNKNSKQLPQSKQYHSFLSLQQDESYWAGQQIMRRLSEPSLTSSELDFAHPYFEHPYISSTSIN